MLYHSTKRVGCLEHSDLLTVTAAGAPEGERSRMSQSKAERDRFQTDSRKNQNERVTSNTLKSNYGLFKRNSSRISLWSWNYRGCWHQTCPPLVFSSVY